MPTDQSPPASAVWAERVVTGAAVLLPFGVLALVLWSVRRGIGLWDEGYVLALIADPRSDRAAGEPYLFGFVLHPLLEASGNTLVGFRYLGLALVLALAVALSHEVFRGYPMGSWSRAAATLTVAAASTLALSFGVRVLGYRSLVVMGLAIVIIAIVRLRRGRTGAAGMLGVGAWMVFCGKPTSAVALLVVLAVSVPALRELVRVRTLALGALGVFGAATLTLLAARLSPPTALEFLASGVSATALLGGHGDPWIALGLSWRSWTTAHGLVLVVPFVLAPVVAGAAFARRLTSRAATVTLTVGLTGTMVVAAAMAADLGHVAEQQSTGWLTASATVAIGLAAIVMWLRAHAPVVPGLLLAMPWVSAVGSNQPFTFHLALASIFWVVALLALVAETQPRAVALEAVAATMATLIALVVWVDLRDGDGTQDISSATEVAQTRLGPIWAAPDDAAALGSLRELGAALSPDTPVADLSGIAHGYRFYLGGRPLGRAATFGHFPGAVEAARWSMGQESCASWQSAWVLRDASSAHSLEAVFTGRGVDLDRDYVVAGAFPITQGRPEDQRVTIEVLRPGPGVEQYLSCTGLKR